MSKTIRALLLNSFAASALLALAGCHYHSHHGHHHHRHKHPPNPPGWEKMSAEEKHCYGQGHEPGTLDFKNCLHKHREHLRQKKKVYQHEQMRREKLKSYPEKKGYPKKKETGGTVKKPLPPPVKKGE